MKAMYTAVACDLFSPEKVLSTEPNDDSAAINGEDDNASTYRNCISALMQDSVKNLPFANQVLTNLGILSFENINVIHCSQSYGLALTLQSLAPAKDEGASTIPVPNTKKCKVTQEKMKSDEEEIEYPHFKIVYSGDTRPCPRLSQLGVNASLLIHEATFDDLKQDEAIKKRHSTVTEALQVARDMNAFRTILTHFSQRYPNIPPILTDATLPTPIFASDFMNIAFRDLLWAPETTSVMARLFPAEADDEDELDNNKEDVTPLSDVVQSVPRVLADGPHSQTTTTRTRTTTKQHSLNSKSALAKSDEKKRNTSIFIPEISKSTGGFRSVLCNCEQGQCGHLQ